MDDSVALIAQCKVDAPQLYAGDEDLPDMFVPITQLLAMFRAEFTAKANESWPDNPVSAG